MKKGEIPPPVPERVANPRIREDQAFQEFHSNSDRMHSATFDDDFTQAWFDHRPICLPATCEKKKYKRDIYNVPTYSSILFDNIGSFNQKSEFRRSENLNKHTTKSEKFSVTELSLLRECSGNNHAHVIFTAEADS